MENPFLILEKKTATQIYNRFLPFNSRHNLIQPVPLFKNTLYLTTQIIPLKKIKSFNINPNEYGNRNSFVTFEE